MIVSGVVPGISDVTIICRFLGESKDLLLFGGWGWGGTLRREKLFGRELVGRIALTSQSHMTKKNVKLLPLVSHPRCDLQNSVFFVGG